MAIETGFRLYHSNTLELLASLLAEHLRMPAAGRSLLVPDTVLIPQAAMRRWLQAQLAHKFGVAANLRFLTPGEFVAEALDANLGPSADDLSMEAMQWRLYAALGDSRLLALTGMAGMAGYLAGADGAKRWALAGELARVFNKYAAWRRGWLLEWERGKSPDDPQAILWRAIAKGRHHRARRIEAYLARFVEGDARPAGLPSRLFMFATLNVSPDVLRVMASQARVGVLHFYLPTPTQEYWGDLRTLGSRLRDRSASLEIEDDNPLLLNCGAAGKDFMAMLASEDVVQVAGDITAYPDPVKGEGALAGSLLHRLQSDLLYRRATPGHGLRATVSVDDPSLQFHACHTRLRELQVLHDRLRGLLDDPRFDPPLQPRDIAVLAPDIDQYVPYLASVFMGDEREDRIPCAIADASPLKDEPLAALFLRLLALPQARFGLAELLELLASPPVAEAAGLDEADFERLQAWLHSAGARWGLDAAHRQRLGAPAQANFTWQFALDRLVLGIASGDGEEIAGVAPWPGLEGGMVSSLDALLRLLRVLAHHERLFREPATPAAWRERLLGLLDRLLPNAPTGTQAQRALGRLQAAIDEFAKTAGQVDVVDPVPVDVVRAHFAALLSEADTRAPLLTGGVSFARMVPMRLLPFRVICLLGMNDGDFPRRDPISALNQLTAEIASGKRQVGDRSTRDDDRFLFLQLFASAQDVFYLSWQGADPREGSAREPSPLVMELLAVASAQHEPPAADEPPVAKQLVLAHPLQPFAAGNFGDGKEPRRFSYRKAWHPAATTPSGTRSPLAPWMPATRSLPVAEVDGSSVSVDALHRFFKAPSEQFLRTRMTLRFTEIDAADEDIEPLQVARKGLDRYSAQRATFEALVAGTPHDEILRNLRARAMLPAGPSGERDASDLLSEIRPYAEAFGQWRGDAHASSMPVEIDVDGIRVHGLLQGVYAHGIARWRFGAPNGPSVLRHGLDWLLASAMGVDFPLVEFQDVAGVSAQPRPQISPERAIAALRVLLALRREGMCRPLPFAPRSSWELYQARADAAAGLKHAAERWRGGDQAWAEGDTDALRLAFRSRDPFTSHEDAADFARIAGLVFGAVVHGQPEAIEIAGIALPEDDETEDMA